MACTSHSRVKPRNFEPGESSGRPDRPSRAWSFWLPSASRPSSKTRKPSRKNVKDTNARHAGTGNLKLRFMHPQRAAGIHPKEPTFLEGVAICVIGGYVGEILTNPLDVVKTRLQNQGIGAIKKPPPGGMRAVATTGAAAAGAAAAATQTKYKGLFDCLWRMTTEEGPSAWFKGLGSSLAEESFSTPFGMGCIQPALDLVHPAHDGKVPVWKRILVGMACGLASAVVTNPLEVFRFQTQISTEKGAGARALRGLVQEGWGGVRKLYRGTSTTMARAAASCAIGTTTYSVFRGEALERGWLRDGPWLDMASAFVCSFTAIAILNPVDIVRARLYGQPVGPDGKGTMFKGPLDAFWKTLLHEGPAGFYAGIGSSLLTSAPDRMAMYTTVEQLQRWARAHIARVRREQLARNAFRALDRDGNGQLDEAELRAAFAQAYPREEWGGGSMSAGQYESFLRGEVRRTLDVADVDKSRTLDIHEFIAAAEKLEGTIKRHAQHKAFDAMDRNGDGSLSPQEVTEALRSVAPRHLQDALITDEQYEAMLRRDVERLFRHADRDRSGSISFEEFTRVADDCLELQSGRVLLAWMRAAPIAGPRF
eukprot:tig00001030_g6454.t1